MERQGAALTFPGLNTEEFTHFKFPITLYYTSRTSSKRNTAKSFKYIIFIRGDCQKGANQLIYC